MRDIDKIIELVCAAGPAVNVEQLKVLHPGNDDDGLWFFSQPESPFQVQLESSTGMCPFLIETDETDARFTANTVEAVVERLSDLLHLAKARAGRGN
jgi:hypothetical protein